MKNIARFFLVALTATALQVGSASTSLAQQTEDDMVKGLIKKRKPKTRGFSAPSTEDLAAKKRTRQFIRKLKTRQIMVEGDGGKDDASYDERKKLDKIIKKHKMPSIDLVIYFEFDSDKITQESLPTLIKLGKALTNEKLKGASILLAGHTDAKGSDKYNLDLSRRRAASVKRFLTKQFGLQASDLIAIGYGEEQLKNDHNPLSPENRRVQVTNLSM